jgi:outer membrane receptor protein involved in Fe transport
LSQKAVEIRSVVGEPTEAGSADCALRDSDRHGRGQRRPGRERSHLPHRRGPRPVHQGAAGERVFRLSSLVTLTTPGVAADSNGLFHGLGDHASNSFSVDGQSITDQQSKVFSNQIPANSIQSIEVISGAPPAEYGGKTSLVIVATTRSGQGVTKPTGSISSSYGAFGSATAASIFPTAARTGATFVEADGLNTGRFPRSAGVRGLPRQGQRAEFFDRVDYSFTRPTRSISTELQPLVVPDAQLLRQPECSERGQRRHQRQPHFGNVGNADQRSKIGTINISPTYTRVISNELGLQPRRLCPQRMTITTIPAAIRWPTWDRRTCKPRPSPSTAR